MTIILLQIKSKTANSSNKPVSTGEEVIDSPKTRSIQDASRNGVVLNENTYPEVMECLSRLLSDSFENIVVLREAMGLEVLILLSTDQSTQQHALDLLEVVVKESASYSHANKNPTRKEIGDSILRELFTR